MRPAAAVSAKPAPAIEPAPRAPASALELPSMTVLMPVRNEEAAITRCLETLLAHPSARWRPVTANPNFVGVYRLAALDTP